MAEFTRALGVGCDHCHLQRDWSSDENILKPLTRVMITMQESLRSEFFEGRDAVSCWTCHRGEAMPQSNLPAALLPEPGVN
jgi:photosynthetic reaction center cytochrome c subunit